MVLPLARPSPSATMTTPLFGSRQTASVSGAHEVSLYVAYPLRQRRQGIWRAGFVAALFFSWAHVAFPATCDDDSLSEVAADGEILVMLSGDVYRVLPGDTIDSALWLPPSDVIICARTITVKGKAMLYYEIINVDDKEKVGATRLR